MHTVPDTMLGARVSVLDRRQTELLCAAINHFVQPGPFIDAENLRFCTFLAAREAVRKALEHPDTPPNVEHELEELRLLVA